MFKTLNFYLFQLFTLSLLFNTVTANSKLPNREMIILLETTNAENLDATLKGHPEYKFNKILHPTGISAITVTLLIALYQKAAPIIANKSLIKNIIDHQDLFSDFINLDRATLYSKYSHYNRFKGRLTLDNFRTNCQYFHNSILEINKRLEKSLTSEHLNSKNSAAVYKILDQIATDPRFNLERLPSNIKRLNQDDAAIQGLELEMIIYTLCSWIDFKKNWQIKQVNDDIFLLIPADYIKNLNLANNTQKTVLDKTQNLQFTDLELELGLKIDHMKNVDRSFFEQLNQKNHKEIPFKNSLAQIFITHHEFKKNLLGSNTKNSWSFYMAGHGLPKQAKIELLPQLFELKKLYTKKVKSPKFKACLAYEKNNKSGLSYDKNHPYSCKYHTEYKKYIGKIKSLNDEIKKIEPMMLSSNKIDHGIICSLSIDEFREVLKFFNNELETIFLYYTSCFAGGKHLIQTYTEIESTSNNKPLVLNYHIISGTPAENMSLQEFPFINIPPYSPVKPSTMLQPSAIHIDDIDLKNKRLQFHTTLQFNKFFGALRKGIHNDKDKILLVPYSLHPHIDKFGAIRNELIPNIPLIRFAHLDHFQPIPNDNSSIIVDANNSSQPIIINKDATLLYSDHILGKLTLNPIGKYKDRPQFLSMIPGFALHVFEEISSSTLDLKEIVNSFLTFPELGSSKIFWIKKLECKKNNTQNVRTEVLNDVIIMRNVFNSHTLDQCANSHPSRPTALENCAYFSTNANKESKLTWNGPFIESNNYRINTCNQSEHKEECLNCFPHITSLLSPVLQSI